MSCYQCGGRDGTDVTLCPACRDLRLEERRHLTGGGDGSDFEGSRGTANLGGRRSNRSVVSLIVFVVILGSFYLYLKPVLDGEKTLGEAIKGLPRIPFINAPNSDERSCTNKCGDGTCDVQTLGDSICIGNSCPCPETAASCPSDCVTTACVKRCGDGKCARKKCVGNDCSCREDRASCPQDCCELKYVNGQRVHQIGCIDE